MRLFILVLSSLGLCHKRFLTIPKSWPVAAVVVGAVTVFVHVIAAFAGFVYSAFLGTSVICR